MLGVLRQRNFGLLWLAGFISMVGDWVLFVALPIYVYQLTGSALATSGMLIALIVPRLLLGSVAGVFVDRWDRKRTMVVANVLMALSLLPLLVVRSADWVWLVYVVASAQSVVGQFFAPAENALLPRLVDEQDLIQANSLNALNNNLARLLGPPLGGAAAALFGLGGVALIDAASFLVAAALIALIAASGEVEKTENIDAAQEAAASWRAVWRDWLRGLELVRRSRLLAILFGIRGITSLGEGVFGTMFVIWVSEILGGGAPEFGWLMSGQAVGGLLGGLVVGYAGRMLSPDRLFGLGLAVFGILDLALFNYPLLFSGFWIGMILMVLVGIPTVGAGAAGITMLQSGVRVEYRGRVFGALGTTSALLMLAGSLIAGGLGDVLSPITLLNVQGGSYVAAGLLALLVLPGALRAHAATEGGAARPERAMAGNPTS